MRIAWHESPEELAGLLRRHGLTPERVGDVEAAWQAFREFLARPVDGLAPGPDSDADGFVVQWGRHGWHDHLPSLSFTRQLAVHGNEPEYWQVSLDMVFPDAPALAGLDRLDVQNSGFDFSPPGPGRDRAIGAVRRELRRHPTLRALWAATPLRSGVTLERAD